MKLIESIQFLITFILILPQQFTQISAALPAHHCFDIYDPIKPRINSVPCRYVKADISKRNNKKNKNCHENSGENMFKISNFRCTSNDINVCNKVKASFEAAGRILSNSIILNTPINCNVSYFSFCEELKDCPNGTIHLGSASPQRSILLGDDDNVNRYYPQALVKQFDFDSHPEFLPSDIVANFNSEVKWFFEGSSDPIKSNEMDLTMVFCHELIHGLGFKSNWGNWISTEAVFTYPTFSADPKNSSIIIFDGFMELAFDKYLKLLKTQFPELSDKPAPLVSAELNKFASGPGTRFNNTTEFILEFLNSTQYVLAEKMYNITTKANTLGFIPTCGNSEPVILDTSFNPFAEGTSVSHVDLATFNRTSDFLMKAFFNFGTSLDQFMKDFGDARYGPVGPRLRQVLETLGYQTTTTPKGLKLYKPSLARPQGFPLSYFNDN